MQVILSTIWFISVILPILIIQEGWEMFAKFVNKHHLWPTVLSTKLSLPYVSIVILIIAIIVLWSNGYRW